MGKLRETRVVSYISSKMPEILITGWITTGLLSLYTLVMIKMNLETGTTISIISLGIALMVANVTIFLSLPNTWKEGKLVPLGKSILMNTIAALLTVATTAFILLMLLGYMFYLSYDSTNPKIDTAVKEETLDNMLEVLEPVRLTNRTLVNSLITEFIADGGSFDINGAELDKYSKTTCGLTTYDEMTVYESTAHLPFEFKGLRIVIRETSNKEMLAYELLHELGHYLEYKARACGKSVDMVEIIEFENNRFGVSGKYLQKELEQVPEMLAQYELGDLERDKCEVMFLYYVSCMRDNEYRKSNLINYYSMQSYYGNNDGKLFMAAATLIKAGDMIANNIEEFVNRMGK